jgi:hypothetical protein
MINSPKHKIHTRYCKSKESLQIKERKKEKLPAINELNNVHL